MSATSVCGGASYTHMDTGKAQPSQETTGPCMGMHRLHRCSRRFSRAEDESEEIVR